MEFSAGSCIRFGWETFKKRPWFLIGAGFVYVLVLGCISGALKEIGTVDPILGFVVGIVNAVVEVIAGMGLIAFMLKAHDDVEHLTLKDFWHPQPFWVYLGTIILFMLILLGGFILLIIPGIIFGIMYQFATYFVIDRSLQPIAALKESARITKGHRWALFGFGILCALITILGLMCLILGILVAIPVTSLAFVHAYRVLSARTNGTQVTV